MLPQVSTTNRFKMAGRKQVGISLYSQHIDRNIIHYRINISYQRVKKEIT